MVTLIILFTGKESFGQIEVERPLGDFSSILIQYNVEAELIKGSSNRVVLTITGIKENKVISTVEGGKLTLGFDSDKNLEGVSVKAKIYSAGKLAALEVNYSSSLEVKDVAFASSLSLAVAGSSSLNLSANTTSLQVNVSGSSTLNLTSNTTSAQISIGSSGKAQVKIEAKEIDATTAGKGRLDIDGVTESLKINSNGSAKFMGYGLMSKTLIAQGHSNGYAEVTVSESILANVVSGGKIYYKGNPADVKVNATSSGIVEKVRE